MEVKKPETAPYDFLFVGGITNVYTFVTSQLATYAVRFISSSSVFDDEPSLGQYTYELVIELVIPSPERPKLDSRIGPTIAAVCEAFLREHERVLLYVCETSDGRHLARVRKFDWWYEQYDTQKYFAKIDTHFPDPNGKVFHVSLLVRWKHPEFQRVIAAFERLAARLLSDK